MASLETSRNIKPTSKRVADDMPQPQQHPKKPKQTISVAGLFAKKPHTGREQVASTDGITHKQLSAEEVLTAKAKRHSIYIDVKEATAAYTRGEVGSVAKQLDAIHDELIARIDGLNINGKTLDIPGVPSDAALHAMQDDEKLYRPLEEDIITMSVTKADGTTMLKHVKLGDSIQKLEKLIEDSRVKLTRLGKELNEVDEEIDNTLNKYNEATKLVRDDFKEKIKAYQAEVQTFHKWTIDEITKARKEDKAYGVEANRKLQEFAASLI